MRSKGFIRKSAGFTLIELAIVLVLIALMVGGIMGAKSLMHSSEIQYMVRQISSYRTAVNTFLLQYSSLPGDMPNASDYWGAQCGGASAAPGGCNGNGNNQVEEMSLANTEAYRFWQHLSLAELVNASYTGVGNPIFVPGENVPIAMKSNKRSVVSPGYMQRYNIQKNLFLIAVDGNGNIAAVPVADAYQIDVKEDNGRADSGSILATDGWAGGWVPGCTNISTATPPADYNVALNGLCRVYFIFDK